MKQPKPKKCKICKKEFQPWTSTQRVCCTNCAVVIAKDLEAKKKRKINREAKEKLKTRTDYLKELQVVFNRYIRLRDRNKPCISCGRHHQGQYHAGHYRTTAAAPELRFNENNCHKQCQPCNTHLSGNIVEYRLNLINKIGQQALDDLESYHPQRKWNIPELEEMKRCYRERIRKMETI